MPNELYLKRFFFSDLANAIKTKPSVVAYSVTSGMKTAIAAEIAEKVVYIASSYEVAANVHKALSEYGKESVLLCEVSDVLLHRKVQAKENTVKRLTALYSIIKGATHIVATVDSVNQLFPDRKSLEKSIVELKVGDDLDVYSLKRVLVESGYREGSVDKVGEFRSAGGDLEIYCPLYDNPLKLSFFGDTLESIKCYDRESALISARLDSATILPVSDILTSGYETEHLERRIRARISKGLSREASVRLEEIVQEIILGAQATVNSPDNIWLLPFLRDSMSDFFDYIPKDAVVVLDEPNMLFQRLTEGYSRHLARVSILSHQGEVLDYHKRCLLTPQEVFAKLEAYHRLGFSDFVKDVSIASDDTVFDLRSQPVPNYFMDISLLVKDVEFYANEGYRILVFSTLSVAERLQELFASHNITASLGRVDDLARGQVTICESNVSKGYIWQAGKLLVIGRQDIRQQAVRDIDKPRANVIKINPKEGDYVVHKDYGIAKYLGSTRMRNLSEGERDYMILQFQGTEKLYLPAHCIDLLSFYSGEEESPKLSKLSGGEFAKVKEQVKSSVRTMAIDLLDLYSKREKARGHVYSRDTVEQLAFEASFPYELTPDQDEAVRDIKKDMESGKIMDRLLCGDVGFGKTEVALRAIFKTVVDGKQVAFLAPTTILVEQHFVTMRDRFAKEGVRVAALTRFRSKQECKDILDRLRTGRLDVVVATHKLLYSDAEFFDLGLLVLDEEQRFGVEDKEKVKALRQNVNVLSMTATPIPRTLHMALSGIRDVSTLQTPPKGRKPVETVLVSYSDSIVVDAVQKEMQRSGLTYILYNRVKGLETFAAHVQELLPSARIATGHGRMAEEQLSKTMYGVYNGDYDIFIATTIIENGLDIPSANTLIIIDADKLGLSELYQLRGRVGRSVQLAVAYFTYKEDFTLTEAGFKRLSAMVDNSALGSGYRLALRDLEMRGAGNVLGREQHGHIMRVGYDTYTEILQDAVSELQGEKVVKKPNTEVKVKLDAFLPNDYVSDEITRIKIHRQIAEIKNDKDAEVLLKELSSGYGEVPKTLVNLVSVSLLRVLGRAVGVTKIVIEQGQAYLLFSSTEYLKSKAIVDAVQSTPYMIICQINGYPAIKDVKNIPVLDKKVARMTEFLIKCNNL